jgi:hypothetical protein
MATTRKLTRRKPAATPSRRRKTATAKPTVRRRRVSSSMSKANLKGAAMLTATAAAGGAAAKVISGYLTQPIADTLGGSLRPYASAIAMAAAAVAMDMAKIGGSKSKILAAGAAGAAGAELAGATIVASLNDSPYMAVPIQPLSDFETLADSSFYASNYTNY